MNPNVDRFMPFLWGPFVPIGIKIGSFVVEYRVDKFGKTRRTNGQTDKSRTLFLRLPVWPDEA